MRFTIDEKNRETLHSYIAIALLVVGVIFAGMGFFSEPIGEISNSVLGFIGECFFAAGSLLGVLQYVDGKYKSLERKIKQQS